MTHNKGKYRYFEGKELFTRAANRHLMLEPILEKSRWNKRVLMVTAIEEALTNKLIGEDPSRVLPIVQLVGHNLTDLYLVVYRVRKFLNSVGYPLDDSQSFSEFTTWIERQQARHLALLYLAKYCEKEYIKFEYEVPSKSRFLRHDGRTGWNL